MPSGGAGLWSFPESGLGEEKVPPISSRREERGKMERADLTFFRRWFTSYVAGHYGPDGNGPGSIRLKEDHTARTCKEITLIGHALKLAEADLLLAEAIALFHDLGRFPQWRRYGTFIDRDSEDHARLGLAELARFRVLDRIAADEAALVEDAIRHHNEKELPGHLAPRPLFFARLLRDADKLDIWRLVIEDSRRRGDGRRPIPHSRKLLREIHEGRIPDFDLVQAPGDMQLLRLAWVYDLNFAATCRKVLERGYLEALFEALAATEDMHELRKLLTSFLERRLEEEDAGTPGTP
jgi:HD domain